MSDNPYLDALERTAAELASVESQASELREKRLAYMWEARRIGASFSKIAQAAGVTKAYVHQVVKAERLRQEAEANES